MKKSKYYYNRNNGDITFSKDLAMLWYRNGAVVEVWENGKNTITYLM